MFSLITGAVLIGFAIFAIMPNFLAWGPQVIEFLKGSIPVFAAFFGLICLFIGAADIKDKNETKKEEKEAAAREENLKN